MFTRFEPVRQNRIADAKAKKLAYDIIMSTDSARPRRLASSPPHAERTAFPKEETTRRPQGESASKLCANCGGDGHLLAHCITAKDGAIRICFFCRDDSHLTDECGRFRRLSLTDKVKLLVVDRGDMPALATKKPWWRYLYDILEADDSVRVPHLTTFPWTPKYAVDLYVGDGIHAHQAKYDSTRDRSVLPRNINIRNLEHVYTFYWSMEFLLKPRRFDEIMQQSTGSQSEDNASMCDRS
jgi:hypothetical protein